MKTVHYLHFFVLNVEKRTTLNKYVDFFYYLQRFFYINNLTHKSANYCSFGGKIGFEKPMSK